MLDYMLHAHSIPHIVFGRRMCVLHMIMIYASLSRARARALSVYENLHRSGRRICAGCVVCVCVCVYDISSTNLYSFFTQSDIEESFLLLLTVFFGAGASAHPVRAI